MTFGDGEAGASFLRIETKQVEEIEKLWAELIEKGGDMDDTKKQLIRAKLHTQLQKLGVLNSNGVIDTSLWANLVSQIAQRKTTPLKPKDYPDLELFKEKFEEYKRAHEEIGLLRRHTQTLPEYLYGLGIVMSDKLVYETVFKNDRIQIRDSEVTNGRHREAALGILRMCGFRQQMPWVTVEYED